MEQIPIGEVPQEEKVTLPKKEKTGFSKITDKIKTGIALGTAIAGIGMSELNEAQGADRLPPSRRVEQATPSQSSTEKTIETPLGPLTYTNPIDALLTRVPYKPKIIKKTTSFSAGLAGHNKQIVGKAQVRHSSRVINQGSQSRRIKHQ